MSRLLSKRALAAVALVVLVAAGVGASARGTGHTASGGGTATPTTLHEVAHDTSAPLQSKSQGPISMRIHAPMLPEWREQQQGTVAAVDDPLVQRAAGSTRMPAATRSFEGLALADAGGASYLPPDPNGDVSTTQYVQAVNGMLAVYTKAGSRIAGPIANLDFWSGLGGHCDTLAAGDPTVVYDSYADRWVVSEFAFATDNNGNPVAPYYQCVAVSTTADATGTWNRYEFLMNNVLFPDYPKIGVWPDGYYMSVNEFSSSGFVGAGAVVFERSKMLLGQSAQAQYIDVSSINPNVGGILPADADGPTPPAAGSPEPFLGLIDDVFYSSNDRLQVWNFHVDWATPGNSSFTLGAEVPVAPVSTSVSSAFQPGHLALDAIGSGQMMFRLQWRNLGGTPTMVANDTVVAGSHPATGDPLAGIRWYILSNPGSGWALAQQGTYAGADGGDRWMGSAAMDAAGDVALGFSVTNEGDALRSIPSEYPSLHYVGRLAGDPAGTMPQGETSLIEGSSSQLHASGRWGDYSDLTVDPTDDCTFWFTGEYYPATSASNAWRTRIGSFSFPAPACTAGSPAPYNSTPPTFTGSAIESLTLSAGTGTWAGSPTSYAYQWRRCDGTTSLGCTDIAGATSNTYTVQAADIGARIRVLVTATNGSGGTQATSIATPVVVPQAPVNVTPPAVSGTVGVDNYLSVSNGTWTSSVPITYTHRWERCDAAGANCTPITGVTSSSYQVQTADVGHRIRGVTIASNTGGAATANSATTIVVPAPPPPTNTTLPSISGTAVVGQTLTGVAGAWTAAGAISYTYEWRRCDSLGANCAAIPSATSTAYAVTGLDAGSTLRFAVTATNGGGSTTSLSAQTVLVPGGGTSGTAPVVVVPPAVSGTFQVGQTVSASPGTWSGTAPIAYTFAWQRCDAVGSSCGPIPGETTTSYLVVAADAGSTLRFAVTASNGAGAVTATSPASGVVTLLANAPVVGTQPTLSGSAQVGQALTGTPGTWSGTAPITYTYAWQRCDAGGASCVGITGASGLTYTVTTADQGSTLRFAVTAANSAGSVTATSTPSALVPTASSGGGSGGSGSGGGGSGGGGVPPELAVTFYATPTPTAAGATLNYYVTVTNNAIQGATGVYVDFTVPTNVTVTQTFADRGPGCIGNNSVVTCPLDFLPGKASATVTITVKVNANGSLQASASVREIETDANPSNNSASGTIEAGAPAKTTNAVPTGLNGEGKTTTSTTDKVRPTVAALSNRATHGQRVALRFKVYDDRGVARVTGTVKDGTRVLATLKTGFGPVVDKSVYYLSWNVPTTLTGNLAFCVVAADRAGNTSKSSCAPLSVR